MFCSWLKSGKKSTMKIHIKSVEDNVYTINTFRDLFNVLLYKLKLKKELL